MWKSDAWQNTPSSPKDWMMCVSLNLCLDDYGHQCSAPITHNIYTPHVKARKNRLLYIYSNTDITRQLVFHLHYQQPPSRLSCSSAAEKAARHKAVIRSLTLCCLNVPFLFCDLHHCLTIYFFRIKFYVQCCQYWDWVHQECGLMEQIPWLVDISLLHHSHYFSVFFFRLLQ